MSTSKRPPARDEADPSATGEPVKQWDVRSLSFRMKQNLNWGLNSAQTATAWQILESIDPANAAQEPAYPIESASTGSASTPPRTLPFAQVRSLIAFLYNEGRDTSKLGEAIDAYASAPSADSVREWQQTLRGFFSRQGTDPYNLVVDGKWGKTTEEAMRYMQQVFHLADADPTPDKLRQLKEISERVVKVRATDDQILLQLEHNPFCIIDNSREDYELKIVRNETLALFAVQDNEELLYFPDYFAIPQPNQAPFNRFSAWWALLNLKSVASMAPNQIFLEGIQQPRISIDDLEPAQKAEDFFVSPDYLLTIGQAQGKLNVEFRPPSPFRLICVFFTADLDMKFYPDGPGELSYDFQETNFVTPNIPGKDGFINGKRQFRKKANFLKLFVVQGFTMDTNPHYGMAFPGIDLPPAYYALMTAAKNSILYARTIGITLSDPVERGYGDEVA